MAFRKKFKLADGSEILIEQITGREDVREFLRYINSFVKERAPIFVDKPLSIKEEKEWFKTEIAANKSGKSIYLKLIANGRLIGTAMARRGHDNEDDNVEVGLGIIKEWRGKGLGRELLSTAIALAKKRLKPKNIYLSAFEMNKRAIKLYKSLGFEMLANYPNWARHYGKYENRLIMLLKK